MAVDAALAAPAADHLLVAEVAGGPHPQVLALPLLHLVLEPALAAQGAGPDGGVGGQVVVPGERGQAQLRARLVVGGEHALDEVLAPAGARQGGGHGDGREGES